MNERWTRVHKLLYVPPFTISDILHPSQKLHEVNQCPSVCSQISFPKLLLNGFRLNLVS